MSTVTVYLQTAEKQIKKGTVGLDIIKSNLTRHFKILDEQEFNARLKEEYDLLYPATRDCTQHEYEVELGLDYDVPEYHTLKEFPQVLIDYSEDENYVTFEEYKNETKEVLQGTSTEVDGNGVEYQKEIFSTELVREFVPRDYTEDVKQYLRDNKVHDSRAILDYETKVRQLTEGVPNEERQTWYKQELEARAFVLNPEATTPMLDALATARGINKEVLVSKIIQKADLYASAIGALTGERQRIEDEYK